jgi:hypothetical protein
MNNNGLILYEGPSRLDPSVEIVAIATGLATKSTNTKTGDMIQTWIIRSDMSPSTAAYDGSDSAICGVGADRCTHALNDSGKRSCYVRVPNAPRSVYESYKRGNYPKWDGSAYAGKLALRIGSYGDPVAIPLKVWSDWIGNSKYGWTGYTHQWRNSELAAGYQQYLMASTETAQATRHAEKKDWRAFYVRPKGSELDVKAITCPASKERNHKLDCDTCLACSGSNERTVNRRSVTIQLH